MLTAVAPAAAEYLPAGQSVQVLTAVAPTTAEYLPAEQSMQAEAPAIVNLPAEHSVQLLALAAECLPAGQSVQVLASAAASAVEYVPGAHSVHGDRPPTSEYCPATHLAHPKSTSLILSFWLSATAMYLPSEEKDTPLGLKKEAAVPTPLTEPIEPDPASATTAPVATVMTLIMLLALSATAMYRPSEEKDTPVGLLNEAAVPTPSTEPELADPASVTTAPVATVMSLIMLLTLSATAMYRPSEEKDTP